MSELNQMFDDDMQVMVDVVFVVLVVDVQVLVVVDEDLGMDDWVVVFVEQNQQLVVVGVMGVGVFQLLLKVVVSLMYNDIEMIFDILVKMIVEFGCMKIVICNLLQFVQGLVVEFDGMVGELMDVFVNGCLIVQGEVVVVNDKFGICFIDIIMLVECIWKLN